MSRNFSAGNFRVQIWAAGVMVRECHFAEEPLARDYHRVNYSAFQKERSIVVYLERYEAGEGWITLIGAAEGEGAVPLESFPHSRENCSFLSNLPFTRIEGDCHESIRRG